MKYCSAAEYELAPVGEVGGTMAVAHRWRFVRWHAVQITSGKPEKLAVDDFEYEPAHLAADRDWEREHLARCRDCVENLGAELTGDER